MTIKEIRTLTGLSQVKFCEKYHIPLNTFARWEQGKREPPDYLVELLEFKVREDLKNMSAEEFYEKMSRLKNECGEDYELFHVKADDLMCELLKEIGYSKGVEVFENADVWYS